MMMMTMTTQRAFVTMHTTQKGTRRGNAMRFSRMKTTRVRSVADEEDAEYGLARASDAAAVALSPTARNYANGVKLNVDFEMHYGAEFGQKLCVLGSHERLGEWDPNRAVELEWTEGDVWKACVDLPAGGVYFYKYVVKNDVGETVRWQDGSNSMLVLPEAWNVPNGSHYLVEDNFAGSPNETTEISESLLSNKLTEVQGEKTELMAQLAVQRNMTQTALEELLVAREELAQVQSKLLTNGSVADIEYDTDSTTAR